MEQIHKAIRITEVSHRYYKIVHPSRKYTKIQASYQFRQDLSINWSIVLKVLDTIYQEQKELLKNY